VQTQSSFQKTITDPLFLAALTAGPVAWSVLYLILQPDFDWKWPFNALLFFILPVFVYPIIEEIIFRGYLQSFLATRFTSRYGPLTQANVLTSLLFAGMHLLGQPPVWALLVFFPSLVFGYFKDRHNNLLAPILLHGFYNAGFIWLFSSPG